MLFFRLSKLQIWISLKTVKNISRREIYTKYWESKSRQLRKKVSMFTYSFFFISVMSCDSSFHPKFNHFFVNLFGTVKKSYHNLCLTIHPDRVNVAQKMIATEKFKIISKIYEVLMDNGKKTLYDEANTVNFGINNTSFTVTNAQLNRAVSKYAGLQYQKIH